MGTNARVILLPGRNLRMSHTRFEPCTDYMWDGIDQQSSLGTTQSLLRVDKSTFIGGQNAIVIQGGNTRHEVLGNKFWDNYIGVRYDLSLIHI